MRDRCGGAAPVQPDLELKADIEGKAFAGVYADGVHVVDRRRSAAIPDVRSPEPKIP